MFGIYTCWIVTSVKHAEITWLMTVMQFPRQAMGSDGFPTNVDDSIPRIIETGCPFPTFIRASYLDFLPEPIHVGPILVLSNGF